MPAWPRWLRFGVVGAFNTAFSYGIYAACLSLGMPYAAASLTSLVLGLAVSFRTQGALVFGNRDPRRIGRFILAWALIYLVHIALIGGLGRLGVDAYAAGVVALVPVTLLSYACQRFFVFRPHRARAPAPGAR